jgi:hypothetical protein
VLIFHDIARPPSANGVTLGGYATRAWYGN